MMHEFRRIRFAPAIATALLAIVFLTLPALMPAHAAMSIQEVKSDKGVTAWLVEDYSVPIISLRFAFRGGDTQDPAGKEGLVNLMTGLFDEGAGDLDSDAFQSQLDDAGAEMRFNGGRDAIYGSMRMLAEEKDEALALLRLAVEKPRFDQPADRPHPQPDRCRHHRRRPRSRNRRADCLVEARSTGRTPMRARTRAPSRRWPRSPPTI